MYDFPDFIQWKNDGNIVFILHVALVECKPMDLFEFISTPPKMKNWYLEVRASQRVLAIDDKGQTGLQMRLEELVRCQAEDKHNGKTFLCPNAKKDIRKKNVGAIFFGLQEEIGKRCEHLIHQRSTEEV